MKLNISQISTAKNFNPRERVERADVEALTLSMKARGQLDPIVIREGDNELINGKHRLAAAKILRWKEIEVKIVKATDTEARILAVVTNNFGRRLSHLELGKNVYLILEEVEKGSRRGIKGEIKGRLANELGLSVKELEDCLATYRNLHPEARELSSYAVGKRILHVEQLREIRKLPAEKQVAVLKQVVKVKDASAADRLVSAFLAAQGEPTNTPSSPSATTGHAPVYPTRGVTERANSPSANEIVKATLLRLFKEVQFSARGTCPSCHDEIEIPNAKVEFNPPLWRRDLQAILASDSRDLEKREEAVPVA